jgi:hypothetical protein
MTAVAERIAFDTPYDAETTYPVGTVLYSPEQRNILVLEQDGWYTRGPGWLTTDRLTPAEHIPTLVGRPHHVLFLGQDGYPFTDRVQFELAPVGTSVQRADESTLWTKGEDQQWQAQGGNANYFPSSFFRTDGALTLRIVEETPVGEEAPAPRVGQDVILTDGQADHLPVGTQVRSRSGEGSAIRTRTATGWANEGGNEGGIAPTEYRIIRLGAGVEPVVPDHPEEQSAVRVEVHLDLAAVQPNMTLSVNGYFHRTLYQDSGRWVTACWGQGDTPEIGVRELSAQVLAVSEPMPQEVADIIVGHMNQRVLELQEQVVARDRTITCHSEWRDRLVEDAHAYANEQDLCGRFDDFMENHDMPRRPQEFEVRLTLRCSIPALSDGEESDLEGEGYFRVTTEPDQVVIERTFDVEGVDEDDACEQCWANLPIAVGGTFEFNGVQLCLDGYETETV